VRRRCAPACVRRGCIRFPRDATGSEWTGSLPAVPFIVHGCAGMREGGQLDPRAVLPQPLQVIVGAVVLVLDMHNHVLVIEQHPASLSDSFSPYRLVPSMTQLSFDTVD